MKNKILRVVSMEELDKIAENLLKNTNVVHIAIDAYFDGGSISINKHKERSYVVTPFPKIPKNIKSGVKK